MPGDSVPCPLENGPGLHGVIGSMIATSGRGDELEAHLLEAAALLRDESSCHLYVVARDPESPDAVHVTEVWDDEAAHRASLQLPAVQQLIAAARPVIAGMGDRVELRVVGGKGVPTED